MRIPIVERTPFGCPVYAGHPLSILSTLLAVLLLFGALARATLSGDLNVVQESTSPNEEFGLAIGNLGTREPESKGASETPDRALFIVELRTKRVLKEIEPFRRPSSDPSPTYRAVWSSDSTHLGIIARFKRDSELEAYAIKDGKWARLDLPRFDPLQNAQETLNIEGPVTGESEIVSIQWLGDGQLRVETISYINTPRQDELSINYLLHLEEGQWKLSRSH